MMDLMTMTEVASELRVPVDTMRHWRATGQGPSGFKMGRRVLYRRGAVEDFIKATERAELAR